jgi:hypothetical protein
VRGGELVASDGPSPLGRLETNKAGSNMEGCGCCDVQRVAQGPMLEMFFAYSACNDGMRINSSLVKLLSSGDNPSTRLANSDHGIIGPSHRPDLEAAPRSGAEGSTDCEPAGATGPGQPGNSPGLARERLPRRHRQAIRRERMRRVTNRA